MNPKIGIKGSIRAFPAAERTIKNGLDAMSRIGLASPGFAIVFRNDPVNGSITIAEVTSAITIKRIIKTAVQPRLAQKLR